jgi:hypothetical protein
MTPAELARSDTVQAVDQLLAIDRFTFLEHYRFRKPFVLKGGARQLPAFGKWTLDYLDAQIGDITIQPLSYGTDQRDYSKARFIEMAFRDFSREIRGGTRRTLYWFTGPNSENFWSGPGKQAAGNPALKKLGEDFVVPSFLHESEVIYAQMILGTGRNGTVLHHDFGGEAKCLIQLLGAKHVRLVPPQFGGRVGLHSIADEGNFTVSIGDAQKSGPRGAGTDVPMFEAKIEAGDVLYWPSFWLHDIANTGDVNLAINAPIDEVPLSPLMLRHLLAMNLRHLRRLQPDLDIPQTVIRQAEKELLNCEEIRTLWGAHCALLRATAASSQ